MKRAYFIALLLIFAASNTFAKSPSSQNSDIEKYTKIWSDFLDQYNAVLENYDESSPKAQALEKKVQFSYSTMREAYSKQYSRCSMIYKKHMDSGVKKGAPMVKDLELEIENLKIIGGKMKKTMTIDQQKELLKWMNENNLPEKIVAIPLENNKPGARLVKTINGVEFAFRWCPPGTFMMGSPEGEKGRQNNEKQHQVTLTKGFWIMETEVTLGMFKAFVNETGYESKGELAYYYDVKKKKWRTSPSITWRNPWFNQDDNHPVVCVSWNDAVEFCNWLSKKTGQNIQLPTEAQWEYACRAGSTGAYAGNLDEMAWYKNNSGEHTHPVGTKKPNVWGIYDMHGNIGEWCGDNYEEDLSKSVIDPMESMNGFVHSIRGGSWNHGSEYCRSAGRYFHIKADSRYRDLGFRCILIKETPKKEIEAGKSSVVTVNGIEFAFRWCPPGTFMMGSPEGEAGRNDDETQHQVTLTKGFWMMETEVTQKQWKAVMENNPSSFKDDDLPVECVSWNDCQEFCRKTGLQLPTEAQWEYACRAGNTGAFAGNLDEMAWYKNNSERHTHPVGTKNPNAWGLYDMYGNAWEWCQDWKSVYPSGSGTDPTGPSSGSDRISRGGGWGYDAKFCRSAGRYSLKPGSRYGDLGFRCIKTTDN